MIDTIDGEGMMKTEYGRWVPILSEVMVEKETEKAYFGNLNISIVNSAGIPIEDVVYVDEVWIPKKMADNPWFLCNKIAEKELRISNRRF